MIRTGQRLAAGRLSGMRLAAQVAHTARAADGVVLIPVLGGQKTTVLRYPSEKLRMPADVSDGRSGLAVFYEGTRSASSTLEMRRATMMPVTPLSATRSAAAIPISVCVSSPGRASSITSSFGVATIARARHNR